MRLVEDDATGEAIVALLELHAGEMVRHSPPGACHFLDLGALRRPEVTLWSAWDGDQLVGCCALVELTPTHGEIKSMRVAPAALGRGVGRRMLDHVVAAARARDYRRLSLETGTGDAFAPAIGLYESAGFEETNPFGEYVDNGFSRFFTLALVLEG